MYMCVSGGEGIRGNKDLNSSSMRKSITVI